MKYLRFFTALLLASAGSCNGQEEPTEEQAVCIEESAALNTNPAVANATEALMTTAKDDILADFTQFCRIISLTCTADISAYSGDLRAACEAQNGQLVEKDYELACKTDSVSPIEIPGTVELVNLPACVGASCDVNNLPPTLTQVLDDIVVRLNVEVDAALGDSVACEVGSGSGSGSAPSTSKLFSRHAVWNILVGTLSLVSFLSWSV